MPVVKADGSVEDRGKGTPQGGVISPLLANLFLHYGLDMWLAKNYADVKFVRYADDVIVHCKSEAASQQLLEAIRQRLLEIGLRLNDTKTKIVYCKDYRRKEVHRQVQFGFLGFSYQPRHSQNKGQSFTAFVPEISKENQLKIRESIRSAINWRITTLHIGQIAAKLNSKLRGWINYYGLFGKRELRRTLFYLTSKLLKWLSRKHKQGTRKSLQMLSRLQQQKPTLFYYWQTKYR
jgi:hypothetical protein